MKISIRGKQAREIFSITFYAQDKPDRKVVGDLAALGTIYLEDTPLTATHTPAVAERMGKVTFL